MSNIAYLDATASLKKGAGKLKGIFVSEAGSTPTIAVYDTETNGTTVKVLAEFTPVSATNYNFYDGLTTENGIYVVIGGTVKATFYYE